MIKTSNPDSFSGVGAPSALKVLEVSLPKSRDCWKSSSIGFFSGVGSGKKPVDSIFMLFSPVLKGAPVLFVANLIFVFPIPNFDPGPPEYDKMFAISEDIPICLVFNKSTNLLLSILTIDLSISLLLLTTSE